VRVRSLLLGLVATVAACPAPEPPPVAIPPVSTGKVRVRVFTEASPVRLLAHAGRFVFAGTDSDLERWDGSGQVLPLSAESGLSGSHVAAIASDPERRWVWILTEGGLGHYDAGAELYREMPPPPASVGVDFAALARDGTASVAPADEGGVWLASEHGLVYVSGQGGWASTPIKDAIRALARDRAGWLWIAAKGGLIARRPTGETMRIGAAQGCAVTEPRIVVELADDRMLVIGADAEGHDRLALGKQLAWVTYRALPEVRWDAAAQRGVGAVVMGGDRVYRVSPASESPVRPLARDGMRLVAVAGTSTTEWVIDPIDLVVPPGAMAMASADEHLLIGTRDLGTARYRDGDAHPRDWLRRKQMFQDATTLSVACARAQDCWIATGARQAWHWTGDRFSASGPDQVVLAVVRDPTGPIYALHRGTTDTEIHLSRIDGAGWTAVPRVALAMPGTGPEVSFARFAAPGVLWVGLRYHDGVERRAYGLAIVETATGKTTYHRTEAAAAGPADKKAPKMLPIPVGVVDADVRGQTAWFATNEGVARLAGGVVKLWTEADGLRSELARAVTIAPDGEVIVATGAGAGVWNGTAWDFPAGLRFEINDVVATRNGQVWMATERGIAAWDGKKVRRVDMLRGLAENEMLDIAVDQFDRVWARGPGSLTLISQ
jgi:ligand-binding sensor domain-containing protein